MYELFCGSLFRKNIFIFPAALTSNLKVKLTRSHYTRFFIFFFLLCRLFNTYSCACRPSDFTVSVDAGIEPRTVANLTLTARRSSARSQPQNDFKT